MGGRLAIAEEGLEAVIHVGLDVAVEEGKAGLIGGEFDRSAAVKGHDDGVFYQAGRGLGRYRGR